MSENILPPRILFHQNHRPAMVSGEYTLTIDVHQTKLNISKALNTLV
jgi:hypothetical protein